MTAFVVLHYQDIDSTHECIKCLESLKGIEKAWIIVVDNASTNDTGKQLEKDYADVFNVKVILTDENLGFARGNNIGYKIAREKYDATRILVINNDLFIKDTDFLEKLDTVEKKFPEDSIIAPDILSKYGIHQNPFKYQSISTRKQHQIIIRKRIGQVIYANQILGAKIIEKKPLSSTARGKEKDVEERYNIIPHGACVIFMKPWVSVEPLAFGEGTFLFCEEEILFDYCQYKHHKIHYIPWLSVYHMEDAAQNAVASSALEKKKRQLKYEIQSRKVLLHYRKKYKENEQL